uniref:SAM domain-containing protein n=1 Tax=Oryza sativa subsp. japonica TaxID=39947 RepID=Q7EYN7_ORYSJ|nr:hypothetical protein [Oryza sativa Japonica Group]BAD05621.1 hypothetical protein [Oryza sativa Japonica Group]
MENCDAARKKHPKQMTTNKAHEPLPEGIKVATNIKKAQENATSSRRPVAPVVKANHASIQGQFHENIEKAGNSFGNIYKGRAAKLAFQLWWFVDILDSEKLGMHQIVSLTMNQLKDMGLDAVGPRRKLIHGIESVSQPNEFEMFS